MLNRVLIAIFGIPALAYIYYNGGILLLIFVNLIIGFGMYEFFNMAEKSGKPVYRNLGIAVGLLSANLLYMKNLEMPFIGNMELLIITTMVIMIYRVLKNRVENASTEIGVTLLGIIYVSFFFSHMLLISFLPNGGKWLLTLQVLVWICDSFAYFTGLKFGRKFFKKGFSEISPKKSVEGAIGGTLFTMLTLVGIDRFFNLFTKDVSIALLLVMGLLLSLFIQIGDLAESMFKREFKIKDSSRILGEHGGILDRFDSLIFVLPVAYYFLQYVIG